MPIPMWEGRPLVDVLKDSGDFLENRYKKNKTIPVLSLKDLADMIRKAANYIQSTTEK